MALSLLATKLFVVRTTLAGVPMTIELGGIIVLSATKLWPATIEFSPITAPSITVAPMPIRQLSPMVQPCSTTRCVIEQ